MYVLVKLGPDGICTDWGFRGPYPSREEAWEQGKRLITDMWAELENSADMTLDLHGLYYHPAHEGDAPETVVELEILKLGGDRFQDVAKAA